MGARRAISALPRTASAQCVVGAPTNHGAVGKAGCALGRYQAAANLGDNSKTATCQTCPAGYSGRLVTGYGGHCFQCTAGTYQPNRGQTSCLPCNQGAGTPVGFAPNAARTTCALAFCPSGQAKAYDAATKQMQCAKCAAGNFSADSKQACASCNAG